MLQINSSDFQNPIEAIYDCAASADSIQEIIENFYHLTNISAVIADSLNYIIALTPDIREKHGYEHSWNDLAEKGVLPLIETPNSASNAVSPFIMTYKDVLNDGKTLCIAYDICYQNNVLMKLAAMSENDLDNDCVVLTEALAKSLYTVWFRLRYNTNSNTDDKSRFLLSLLKGNNASLPSDVPDSFTSEGPFIIASMSTDQSDLMAITISELSRIIGKSLISVFDNNEYVFLINVADTGQLSTLERFSKHHKMILGISQQFFDLSKVPKYHSQAKGAAMAASRFASFNGCAMYDDMKLFLMFDMISKTEAGESLLDPQVELLAKSDQEKNTDFMRTLFCWLLNSQRAAAAAKQLGVHRNTLDNRLAKINELIEANWDSSSYCTCMLYSLYITLDKQEQLEFFQ